ncbi:MAG: PAS domain-containing protein, partial [Anaerolineae bacterium]|nr:PAS domain-containing protein [Anaerolineae bacterium]
MSDSRPLVLWPDQCQLVLDMVSDPNVAAMIIDRNAIVLWCNENVAAWMSRTPQQCLGRCLWDISTGGD